MVYVTYTCTTVYIQSTEVNMERAHISKASTGYSKHQALCLKLELRPFVLCLCVYSAMAMAMAIDQTFCTA